MSAFVDTSAFLALLDADEIHHSELRDVWIDSIQKNVSLTTTSYVLIESFALIQRRLGLKALKIFIEDIQPIVAIHWVDSIEHEAGAASVLTAGRRNLSLVDCVSFEVMRKLGIKQALTLDKHFAEQGYICLPKD